MSNKPSWTVADAEAMRALELKRAEYMRTASPLLTFCTERFPQGPLSQSQQEVRGKSIAYFLLKHAEEVRDLLKPFDTREPS